MLLRLVRPMRRKGSHNAYFEQCIPADVKERASGLRLEVPCGEATVRIAIGEHTKSVRFSYRTADPTEVKVRHGQATGYLELVWRALREDQPIPLTHRQAVALAGLG